MSACINSVVIVGAGQSGLQAASSLRDEGYDGAIYLIGSESGLPYQRPPLSKSYLDSDMAVDELHLEPARWFNETRVELVAGEHVESIDRQGKRLTMTSGRSQAYDHLILATGSRNRALPCMSQPVDGVLSLRSINDAAALKSRLAGARHVVVIGAGFLGLEAAAVAIAQGCHVHVLEATERVMQRAVSASMSAAFQRHHETLGVQFSFDTLVVDIHSRDGRVSEVELNDCSLLPADLVLVAIGVLPNSELGATCGLEVRNGFVVDDLLLTADRSISAIGDCAAFPYAFDDNEIIRLESVQNAVDQARYVAQRMLGNVQRYDQIPIFWSEQGGSRLQMVGVARGADQSVVRGDPEAGAFSVFRYRNERLNCVESLNRPADHMAARRLLQRRLSPSLVQAADVSFDLKSLLATATEVRS
ncbi:NAD(P)/FAD-dependent oxidoreductase [Paraburkholderia strydomiana]|uniref:NAD(P)/FAD-dependent oxidoreductase n=1 Tax=Paraburkholderia strydomiana TaxID=1245417 RepID=UPI001BEC0241|nr:FAD-dependent oxidoreductase [Paraburkholderia strydomiana]